MYAALIEKFGNSRDKICKFTRYLINFEPFLDDDSGLNMFGVTCPTDLMPSYLLDFPKNTNISWPECIIHSSCDDLPVPNNASALEKLTEDDFVQVGEFVEYACIQRGEFYETPTVSYAVVLKTTFL